MKKFRGKSLQTYNICEGEGRDANSDPPAWPNPFNLGPYRAMGQILPFWWVGHQPI